MFSHFHLITVYKTLVCNCANKTKKATFYKYKLYYCKAKWILPLVKGFLKTNHINRGKTKASLDVN